jgi:hypothetical protein
MSWIKFRNKYLYHINFTLLLGILLYGVRGDLDFHYLLLVYFIAAGFFKQTIHIEQKAIRFFGRINSTIILLIVFYFILTPYSFVYRSLFQNKSFGKAGGRFIIKDKISSFDLPF